MFGVLRFSATASLAQVVRAIQRTPTRRIALVFPLGAGVAVAEIGRMGVVELLCREQRKEATIVGGDAELRASAIACGLRAAMTVEDWRAMHTARNTWLSWRKTRPSAPTQLTLLPSSSGVRGDDEGGYDPDEGDEVPDYIRELLALHGHEFASPIPIRPHHDVSAAPRMNVIAYDLDRDDDLRELCERDEEQLTETIRRSSGLDMATLAAGWGALAERPSRTMR